MKKLLPLIICIATAFLPSIAHGMEQTIPKRDITILNYSPYKVLISSQGPNSKPYFLNPYESIGFGTNVSFFLSFAKGLFQFSMDIPTFWEFSYNDANETLLTIADHTKAQKILIMINSHGEIILADYMDVIKFITATTQGNLTQVKELVQKGINVNVFLPRSKPALFIATQNGKSTLIQLLIEHGADLSTQTPWRNQTALHFVGITHPQKAAHAFLTTIPLKEKEEITKKKPGIMACALALLRVEPRPPRQIRRLIIQEQINDLVQDHMHTLKQLLAIKDSRGLTPQECITTYADTESAQVLDLDDSANRTLICKYVEQNIRHILFQEEEKEG